MRRFSHEKTRKNTKKLIFTIFFLAVGVVIFASIIGKNTQSVSSQSVENDIDSALYRREEFFGSQAIVPITTAASLGKDLRLCITATEAELVGRSS
mgnify:CR=1 FL=1